MKAGFWMAPDGADETMTILPVGGDDLGPALGKRPVSFLATAGAEELIARCPRAAALLPEVTAALRRQTAAGQGILFDLTDLSDEERDLIGQTMGEGEVSGVVALPEGVVAQVQESVLAGLWRIRFNDAEGVLIGDYLEVGGIPEVVKRAVLLTGTDLDPGEPPAGAMNVMPVLAEIRERMLAHRPGQECHIISFSLFPMSPADMDYLQERLGHGPIQLVSRGYGSCRIVSTLARHVWSVQFFNAMGTVILDTLEIGDVPAAACAADEDFADSAERLKEISEAYFA
ncbi:MAG: hydrogenase expression/formation C-terminal domain-containing protein [Alsobacter sp.]